MYIPKINLENNESSLLEFMQRFSFATVINSDNGTPVATHLPFIICTAGNNIRLLSHFAKANSHWQLIGHSQSLVIFTEPHAYISPKHYDSHLAVPTWNYIAVHAYGQGKLVTQKDAVRDILERTIQSFEQEYLAQWSALPEDYEAKMAKGIVAFEILVTELQGKYKLSQNKTIQEQTSIINELRQSDHSTERDIAAYMQHRLDKNTSSF